MLYVRNLSLTTTESLLKDVFNRASGGDVQKLKMMRDFAFIHFTSRANAEKAMKLLNSTCSLFFNSTSSKAFTVFFQIPKSMEQRWRSRGPSQPKRKNKSLATSRGLHRANHQWYLYHLFHPIENTSPTRPHRTVTRLPTCSSTTSSQVPLMM